MWACLCACGHPSSTVRSGVGKRYGALHGGWGLLAIVTSVFLARLAVDIRLIALIAKLGLWYISTEFERERNVDSSMRQLSL